MPASGYGCGYFDHDGPITVSLTATDITHSTSTSSSTSLSTTTWTTSTTASETGFPTTSEPPGSAGSPGGGAVYGFALAQRIGVAFGSGAAGCCFIGGAVICCLRQSRRRKASLEQLASASPGVETSERAPSSSQKFPPQAATS